MEVANRNEIDTCWLQLEHTLLLQAASAVFPGGGWCRLCCRQLGNHRQPLKAPSLGFMLCVRNAKVNSHSQQVLRIFKNFKKCENALSSLKIIILLIVIIAKATEGEG